MSSSHWDCRPAGNLDGPRVGRRVLAAIVFDRKDGDMVDQRNVVISVALMGLLVVTIVIALANLLGLV